MPYTIDRLEDNGWAVLEREDGETFHVPAAWLPDEAQAFFEAAGGPESDPHRLDSDDDGVACGSN